MDSLLYDPGSKEEESTFLRSRETMGPSDPPPYITVVAFKQLNEWERERESASEREGAKPSGPML